VTRPSLLIEISPRAQARAPGQPVLWDRSAPESSLRAAVLSGDRIRFAEGRLIIAGRAHAGNGAVVDASSFPAVAARAAGGNEPAQALWGDFLALAPLPTGGMRVFRDPAGGHPCYWIERGRGDWLIGSSAADLLAATGRAPSLCPDALGAALLYPDLTGEATALTGIREVLPGCALDLHPDGPAHTRHIWSPLHQQSQPAATESPLVDPLRTLVLDCVRARLRGVANPLLQLSGGLDSSILAAVMSSLDVPFRAVTVWTPSPEGDERRFARAVAERFGIDLEERALDPGHVDIEQPHGAHLPRPTRRQFARDLDAQVQDAAMAGGHDLVVTGGGGDGLFGYLMPGTATADRWRAGALRPGLRTAVEEAAIHRMPMPSVLAAAARALVARPAWHRDPSFLSRDARHLPRPWHPWVDPIGRLPPGKRAHVGAVALIRPYLDTVGASSIAVAAPLMARPLIDFCLSIPTWAWVQGGRNRALARQAFAPDLPPLVANRRGKGSYDRFVIELFARNRHKARDMLLGGKLAELNLLDRPALERWFRSGQDPRTHRLLTLVEAEAWCRHWSGTPIGAAAGISCRQRA
jgi:asparagine synthase (glutamine-hydrolysing)